MQREGKLKVMNVEFFAIRNSAVAFYFIEPSPCYAVVLMPHNGLQIGEGTNSGGIVRGIWAFAYVLLCVCFLFHFLWVGKH